MDKCDQRRRHKLSRWRPIGLETQGNVETIVDRLYETGVGGGQHVPLHVNCVMRLDRVDTVQRWDAVQLGNVCNMKDTIM